MLPEDWTKRIVKQIAAGLEHIHGNNIVHRDMKHMNIFFSNDSMNPRVKIADFGLASRLSDNHPFVTKRLGTVGFMAPEVALEQPSEYKADVWSLGVIVFALISSKVPFQGVDHEDTLEKIINDELEFSQDVWADISDECKDLLTQMLEKDTERRYTI